jgi:hypothetical protein
MKSLLARRTGVWGLAFTAYRLWHTLPPQHRRRLIREAQKQGPRVARTVWDARPRRSKPPL